jgi:hypothetical protein
LWSFATSSSTDATRTPALRTGGASYDVTFIRGAAAATPRSASASSLISFFFAAMIPFSDA